MRSYYKTTYSSITIPNIICHPIEKQRNIYYIPYIYNKAINRDLLENNIKITNFILI